jgi:hypothetical protein
MDYFVGIEAEGPYKGTLTLYIASDKASPESVLEFLDKERTIHGVYFGANGTCTIPERYTGLIYELCDKGYNVLAEIDNLDQLFFFYKAKGIPAKLKVILTFHQRLDYIPSMIKFEGEENIVVLSSMKIDVTGVDDILFSMDKEVQI